MGWPKKNEEMRLYYERGDRTYLLVMVDKEHMAHNGCHEGVGEVMSHPDPDNPQLATTSVSPIHIYRKCHRVSWMEMPEVWQDAFRQWLTVDPGEIRGLWRMEELDPAVAA